MPTVSTLTRDPEPEPPRKPFRQCSEVETGLNVRSAMATTTGTVPKASRTLYRLILTDILTVIIILKIIYLFIIRERGREGEKEGEKYQCCLSQAPQLGSWPSTQACALTRN